MVPISLLSNTMNFVVHALDNLPEKYFAQPKAKLIHGELVVHDCESNSECTFSHQLKPAIEQSFLKRGWHINKLFKTEIFLMLVVKHNVSQ